MASSSGVSISFPIFNILRRRKEKEKEEEGERGGRVSFCFFPVSATRVGESTAESIIDACVNALHPSRYHVLLTGRMKELPFNHWHSFLHHHPVNHHPTRPVLPGIGKR